MGVDLAGQRDSHLIQPLGCERERGAASLDCRQQDKAKARCSVSRRGEGAAERSLDDATDAPPEEVPAPASVDSRTPRLKQTSWAQAAQRAAREPDEDGRHETHGGDHAERTARMRATHAR